MKRNRKFGLNSILFGVLVVTVIVFSSISKKPLITIQSTVQQQTVNKVQYLFNSDLKVFRESLFQLKEAIEADSSDMFLKVRFLQAREQFKRLEYLLNYGDKNLAKEFNGQNRVEATNYPSDQVIYIQPHGLQVMENVLYKEGHENRSKLLDEITHLNALLEMLIDKEWDVNIGENDFNAVIWDALRLEIFRIETLGITGYDVPHSENAIPETVKSLESMRDVVEAYESLAKEKEVIKLHKKGIKKLEKAIAFCEKDTDFDSFDRLEFCREYLHEIGAWINDFTEATDLQLKTGVRPFNAKSDHIFAEDFFNVNYFLNGYSDDKAALGRKLFFDPILSKDGARSCATCHDPEMFFSDRMDKNFNLDKSGLLGRNTPQLYNAIWQTKQFYDSRANTLKDQAFAVIHNEQEMAGNLEEIAVLLNNSEQYASAFQNVYMQSANPDNISHAIASYVATLTSNESRFDYYIRKTFNSYSKEEKNGFNLFMGKAKCATCHFPPMFNGLMPPNFAETMSENIGTPARHDIPSELDSDLGLYEFSKVPMHKHFFKTPSVRNANMSAPMMHNGSYPNVRRLIDFYDGGGGLGQGADNPTQTLSPDSLHLTGVEIFELIQFIRSLEDDTKR